MPEASSARPFLDALIHLTPVASVATTIAVAGSTDLWLAVFLPLGPLLVGPALSGRRSIGVSHLICTLEFAASLALGGLATWAVIWIGLRVDAFALLIPLGLLFTLGLVANFVFLTAAGTIRALRSEVIEYPWVLPLRSWLPAVDETGFGQRR